MDEEGSRMKRAKWLFVSLALTMTLVLGTACDTGSDDSPLVGTNTSAIDTIGNFTSTDQAAFRGFIAPALGQAGGYQQAGIWVTGLGKVILEPDMAILSLGVEVRGSTVETARSEAADTMTGIIEVLKSSGIADRDIQTKYFNIYPEYTYHEINENGTRYDKQMLTGYRVSNTVIIKIRNLEIVGATIDDVVEAGSDAIRIQSIQFTVKDSSEAQVQARENAVLNALTKAAQFATLTGVTRGNLLYITESGGSTATARHLDGIEAVQFADSTVTPISAGELELQISVQVVFAIGN